MLLNNDIEVDDIMEAIENLTTENYFRGIDPSPKTDFEVCAFCTLIDIIRQFSGYKNASI